MLHCTLQVSGRQRPGSRRRGPRTGAHRPRPEHRHATLPSRHRLYQLLSHLRLPVHWDAERETMELPGDLWSLTPKPDTLSTFAAAKHIDFILVWVWWWFFVLCACVGVCVRAREQTDYFGIAATVHCMLFGTYMQVVKEDGVWRSNGMLRRSVIMVLMMLIMMLIMLMLIFMLPCRKPHGDLWTEFFHTLLNVPDCSSLPDLQGLRAKLTTVLRRDYASKLPALKSRLLVQLLENHRATSRQHSL